jgi:starvation-inducible DNA-binding protein
VSAAAKAVRADIDRLDEWGDAVGADLLAGVAAGLDKQLWFLEAHLQNGR